VNLIAKVIPKSTSRAFAFTLGLCLLGASVIVEAACRRPAPTPVAFDKGSVRESCPFGYSTTGSLCTPSGSSARYVLIKPSANVGCPNHYSSSGSFCIADSDACHAFVSSSGNCPSGYSGSRPWCQSD
jgi:hypothetical protein